MRADGSVSAYRLGESGIANRNGDFRSGGETTFNQAWIFEQTPRRAGDFLVAPIEGGAVDGFMGFWPGFDDELLQCVQS